MKLLWLGYLVYSLGNCAMKLCIEGLFFVKAHLLQAHMAHEALLESSSQIPIVSNILIVSWNTSPLGTII
jgi:hypothetical protein